MHDDSAQVHERIDRFTRERLQPAIYRSGIPLVIEAWAVPDEPVPFAEAVAQQFVSFVVGTRWGKPWGTTWFHLSGTVPHEWAEADDAQIELVFDLGFDRAAPGFQVEGTVYSPNGMIMKAVESRNRWVPVTALPGEAIDVYIEAAANPDLSEDWTFAPTPLGDKTTAGTDPLYTFRQADVALRDLPVWELAQDIWALDSLMHELPATLPRRAEILRALEDCLDLIDPHNVSATAAAGRAALADVLASPAYTSAHRLHAVGHAHIDSAWLWPVRETVRKVARTFSNVLDLIEANSDFVFAASSAQQYAWLKEHYPALFDRVKAAVASGNFVPVGGMWVESDTNMPGGEALARQFVAGKRFFMEEFGVEPLDVWLPDSFGYSGALPQIAKAAGSRWFLTQKISWNDTNVFPHHTFSWEGIDGSRIFTHFPPVADYNAQLSGAELARAERLYAEKGRANTSLIPFGWGDGGGGPTIEMIAAARRTASLEGSPTVTLSSPRRFFEAAEAEYPVPPVWSGELYLEFHRGTYTSQARTKQGNRRSEHLLREAELWATTATIRTGAAYPYDALERAWHTVLLQQFHDILPGSAIAWVHREAERNYKELATMLTDLIEESVRAMAGPGEGTVVMNAGPFVLDGVPALGGMSMVLGATEVPDVTSGTDAAPPAAMGRPTAAQTSAGIVLRNDFVAVTIDADGLFSSVHDLVADRELIAAGARGNLLQLHGDTPNRWDAWDIDANYRNTVTDLTEVDSIEVNQPASDSVGVRITRRFGTSLVIEEVSLSATSPAIDIALSIDWHERQKLLKLAFPLDVHAERAASEIQFGHVFRPTHSNTSWDAARFETVAHRWVHVGEPGYGVAVANDSTYGHDIRSTTDAAGRTSTTVRMSLLRAPLYPDPESDQGWHHLAASMRVGAGIPDAITEGYRLNLPLRTVQQVAAPRDGEPRNRTDASTDAAGVYASGDPTSRLAPVVTVDNPAVIVEAVKLAEDRSGDVIVRLYEAHGSRARATVTSGFPAADIGETDLLERPLADPRAMLAQDGDATRLELRPFQLVTLRFSRPR
ncbi:alpha-mannosidase [Leifsonia sp. A12D58]|uniref:alpha-mannosidase n=1 Tax=Leifsonia sp. A12D58 TaxID=3397674 RepID=UPI0039E0678A